MEPQSRWWAQNGALAVSSDDCGSELDFLGVQLALEVVAQGVVFQTIATSHMWLFKLF